MDLPFSLSAVWITGIPYPTAVYFSVRPQLLQWSSYFDAEILELRVRDHNNVELRFNAESGREVSGGTYALLPESLAILRPLLKSWKAENPSPSSFAAPPCETTEIPHGA